MTFCLPPPSPPDTGSVLLTWVQNFNAMIYHPFRKSARIVHMHGWGCTSHIIFSCWCLDLQLVYFL